MHQEQFQTLISQVTGVISGRPLDDALERVLAERFPVGGELFTRLVAACAEGIADGWMCSQEAGGIRYGRVVKPSPATHGFSVDVVQMKDVQGPYHRHPQGEIDLVMPRTPSAKFDGRGAGWCVYGPESAHFPTVTEGEAWVLYLLPQGAIDFKAKPSPAERGKG
ncbi:MAG: DUF4863 family protein [Myxococcota bacterium]